MLNWADMMNNKSFILENDNENVLDSTQKYQFFKDLTYFRHLSSGEVSYTLIRRKLLYFQM